MSHNLELIISRLGDYAVARHYAGYDPYDSLNSPLAGLLTLGTRWGRIALTQLGRRSPVNLRPLLLVRPGVNPKALALFLEGYAGLHSAGLATEDGVARMRDLVRLLAASRSPGYAGNAWGYNFPWQNRWQCLPRYTPTIVNSAFVGHALLDCYDATGDDEALQLAWSIPEFMLSNLRRKKEDGCFCFSYTPQDDNYVHNANMLGASLLARLVVRHDRRELLETAMQALAYSMKYQHPDGAWAYAETAYQSWIDSFHTGFNLEALRWFLKLGLAKEHREAYDVGPRFYTENFFLADDTPKYYHDRMYLVDIHAPTEALCYFASEGEQYQLLTDRVLDWLMANMYDPDRGLFHFRKSASMTIRIPYMRWSLAWAFRALTKVRVSQQLLKAKASG